MTKLLRSSEVATLKGCSKKSVQRACEQGKLHCEYDPVNNEYTIHDDEVLAQWRPGEPGQPSSER